MNIERLKKQADEEMEYRNKIKSLQDEVIQKFETFFEVMEESKSIWDKKMKSTVQQFVSDFSSYFKQNKFEVEPKNLFYAAPTSFFTELEATYKNSTVRLSNINSESEPMYIRDFEDIEENILIALPNDVPNYFVWKDNIDGIAGKRLIEMNSFPKDVYKEFTYQFNTEEDLNLLMGKIDINISHFQESIKESININLCIHRLNTDETYNNFNEFIDSIE